MSIYRSQPRTSTRVPSDRFPVNVHSETPRSPQTHLLWKRSDERVVLEDLRRATKVIARTLKDLLG